MTIDWTQPVETTETPPRHVRVLCDKDGRPEVVHINDNGSSPSFNLFAIEHIGAGVNATRGMYSITLRNVPPPKPEPVLHDGWIIVRPSDDLNFDWKAHGVFSSEESCSKAVEKMDWEGAVFIHAAWMSDRSPVPGEECGMAVLNLQSELNKMTSDRDAWRTKAEEALSLLRTANDQVEARQAEVEAAVAAMMGPVKNCKTCGYLSDRATCQKGCWSQCIHSEYGTWREVNDHDPK